MTNEMFNILFTELLLQNLANTFPFKTHLRDFSDGTTDKIYMPTQGRQV